MTTEPCGTEANPCYVEPLPGTLQAVVVGLGLVLLLLAGVLVAQMRRP